jgi:hypothetical protein
MTMKFNFRPVVQTRSLDSTVIKSEAGNTNDMERGEGRGAEPRDVAGIGWDFRLY